MIAWCRRQTLTSLLLLGLASALLQTVAGRDVSHEMGFSTEDSSLLQQSAKRLQFAKPGVPVSLPSVSSLSALEELVACSANGTAMADDFSESACRDFKACFGGFKFSDSRAVALRNSNRLLMDCLERPNPTHTPCAQWRSCLEATKSDDVTQLTDLPEAVAASEAAPSLGHVATPTQSQDDSASCTAPGAEDQAEDACIEPSVQDWPVDMDEMLAVVLTFAASSLFWSLCGKIIVDCGHYCMTAARSCWKLASSRPSHPCDAYACPTCS